MATHDGHNPAPVCADMMPDIVREFQADLGDLDRTMTPPFSPWRRQRMEQLLDSWLKRVDALPFDRFGPDDRVDWVLLRNFIVRGQRQLTREADRFAAILPLFPCAPDLIALEEDRRQLCDVDPRAAAECLARAAESLASVGDTLTDDAGAAMEPPSSAEALRAANAIDRVGKELGEWYAFRNGYDPEFDWWVGEPYRSLMEGMKAHSELLRNRFAHAGDPDSVVGDPIGREALEQELEQALVPFSPEELIAVAQRELDWCREQMTIAAREMGCGDDWHQALERVKDGFVPPGRQPAFVRDLAREAVDYVVEHDLVTVPDLARETWRMEMLSAESQKVNPFFLGGETIYVSYPTSGMSAAFRRMSFRGNNRSFARATVFHELIPGHHLQWYAQERWRAYRQLFWTPFWIEGWTLHWELLLWNMGFARTPEERIGMLFWRMHRCARVVFSLRFHLGEMTAAECVKMLVDEVGHERENALAELRRSFGEDYGPLYQCAYLIGGMQMQRLCEEMVDGGRMTQREFHDAVLHANSVPVALLRALLRGDEITRDFRGDWRFWEANESTTVRS